MQRRPTATFTRQIYKEKPPHDMRDNLIDRMKLMIATGGLRQFEEVYRAKMADVKLDQHGMTTIDGDFVRWIYVGDLWWCRERTKCEGKKCHTYFEYARMKAVDKDENVIDLWDADKYGFKEPPIIVYKGSERKRGYIFSYNEWEVWILWDDSGPGTNNAQPHPFKDIQDLEFEYTEDFEKFRKILAKLKTS